MQNPDPQQPWGVVYPFSTLAHEPVSAISSRAKTHQAHSVDTECMVSKMHYVKVMIL